MWGGLGLLVLRHYVALVSLLCALAMLVAFILATAVTPSLLLGPLQVDVVPDNRFEYEQQCLSNVCEPKVNSCCCSREFAKPESILLEPNLERVPTESRLNFQYSSSNIQHGGYWTPSDCVGSQKMALIIPFRKRETHLLLFLEHIHGYLQKQKLSYGIYVVDQVDDMEFNRAMLFNVGFLEAMKDRNYTCFVFHDVDHLPMDPLLSYWCDSMPTHMASRTDKWDWRLPYRSFVGGVTKQLASQIYEMNGFANVFWGWGGEDDDILIRWWMAGFRYQRPRERLGNYATIKKSHYRAKIKKDRVSPVTVLRTSRYRVFTDGLNNVRYNVIATKLQPLYTRIRVKLASNPKYEYLHTKPGILSRMFSKIW